MKKKKCRNTLFVTEKYERFLLYKALHHQYGILIYRNYFSTIILRSGVVGKVDKNLMLNISIGYLITILYSTHYNAIYGCL